jgi:SHS2 domain-containing protein
LSLSATKDLYFFDFEIKELSNKSIKAIAKGCEAKDYKINTEIKAATYHELKLEKENGGWKGEVIFDV